MNTRRHEYFTAVCDVCIIRPTAAACLFACWLPGRLVGVLHFFQACHLFFRLFFQAYSSSQTDFPLGKTRQHPSQAERKPKANQTAPNQATRPANHGVNPNQVKPIQNPRDPKRHRNQTDKPRASQANLTPPNSAKPKQTDQPFRPQSPP